MKKFYIFDLDGTLCESMRFWRDEADPKYFSDPVHQELVHDHMREHYRNEIVLKDGVTEFLEKAKAAGVKMCIASATRRDVSEPLLQKTRLLRFMEFYIDCHEVHSFKERPDIYLIAAERMGADISDCAVFEDAEYCAKTAHNAGIFTVGVRDDVAEEEGNTRQFCDLFIEDWRGAELV